MKRFLAACLPLLLAFVCADAQISTPAASPGATFKQTVGLTDITIDYSRPGVKGRTIFAADGLVPYGKIWRTGANAATTVEFSEDVVFGGKDVEAGKYALYTIPNESSWEVMLYSDLNLGGNTAGYDEENEVARVTAQVSNLPFSVETMVFDIGDITDNSCTIGILWSNVYVGIPVKVHTDAQVMEEIESFTNNPMASVAGNYLNSGWYLYNSGKDKAEAAKLMKKGVEYSTSPFKYFWMSRASQVIASTGDYKGAVAMAKDGLKAGAEAPSNAQGFFNDTVKGELEGNIKEWSAKM